MALFGAKKLAELRAARRLVALGLVAVACALGVWATVAASGPPGSARLVVDGGIVRAHTLPGDRLLAGPVLLDNRAVWIEAHQRLLVRSLDLHGHISTLFSTSAAPGAPKGTAWPFYVQSIAASDGRIAFVESVIPCSAPPHTRRCFPSTGEGQPADSVTLFAGRPGSIRPVESLLHPGGHCRRPPAPTSVAITDAGLVDAESAPLCHPEFPRLVLRSFSGRLVRVLARGLPETKQFAAAGDRVALIRHSESGAPDELRIVRLSTGRTVLRLHERCLQTIHDLALDRLGRFALLSAEPHPGSCQQQRGITLRIGQIGHGRLRILASAAIGSTQGYAPLAIAGEHVAYGRLTGRSRTEMQVLVAAPGAAPTPIPGMKYNGFLALGAQVAFNGRLLASAHNDTVQLALLRRR
jgi:hypothetical protein